MISESSEFVWISPKERKPSYQSYPEYLEHHGKWIIYGPKDVIEGLGSKMLGLVGKDDIIRAKFTRNPALQVPEGYESGVHVLIVYCDDRKSEKVKSRLKEELGVDKMLWRYESETFREVMKSKVRD